MKKKKDLNLREDVNKSIISQILDLTEKLSSLFLMA